MLRVAVVGAGYFGTFHAQRFAAHPGVQLVAIVDTDLAKASALAQTYECMALSDHRQLIGLVDAAAVVVPTTAHFDVTYDLLCAGLHVLVEKPITFDAYSAEMLADKARVKGVVLQVGHIERYSAPFCALAPLVERPRYIESYRISPWRERGVDVDVIFDLMIHDIDLILGLVRSPVVDVAAVGAPVFSGKIDIANARISFESGCVATVTASRVSHKTERSLRLFEEKSYLVCDFSTRKIFQYAVEDVGQADVSSVTRNEIVVPQDDSLANEVAAFVDCIVEKRRPEVDGWHGAEAVRIANRMHESIMRHLSTFSGGDPIPLDIFRSFRTSSPSV